MKNQEQDLMDRYIYDVVRRLPKTQREDIKMELEELIGDMYEARNPDNSMEQLLESLGDPMDFAKQYRDDSKCLISPEYYDDYCWLMKIVFLVIGLSAVVSFLIQAIVGETSLSECFRNAVKTLAGGGMSAFVSITITFALLEHQKVKVDLRKIWEDSKGGKGFQKEGWIPKYLPPIPHKKALISRGDSIVGIVFMVIFCCLLISLPLRVDLGISQHSGTKIVSPFNMEIWHLILPLILLSFGLELVAEVIKLIAGRYCKKVMVSGIVNGVIQIIIGFLLLKGMPFFNPDFLSILEQEGVIDFENKWDFMNYWNTGTFTNIILAIMVILSLSEMAHLIYKTTRYGSD